MRRTKGLAVRLLEVHQALLVAQARGRALAPERLRVPRVCGAERGERAAEAGGARGPCEPFFSPPRVGTAGGGEVGAGGGRRRTLPSEKRQRPPLPSLERRTHTCPPAR